MFHALGEPNPSGCNLAEIRKASCRVTVYAQSRRLEFKPGKTTIRLAAAACYATKSRYDLGLTGLTYL